MTQASPLSDTDKQLLSFLRQNDRCLYDFLDASLYKNYAEATRTMSRLISLGWVSTGFGDYDSIVYRLTELGQKCLETGLQLEVVPEPQPERRFFWQQRPN